MIYPVVEICDSIQGEGLRHGRRSVFVRFAGCNLWSGLAEGRGRGKGACSSWCDTEFAEPREGRLTALEIAERADALWPARGPFSDRWVVLTGGEPLLSVDPPLLAELHARGFQVAIETNGTRPLFAGFQLATLSPKIPLLPLAGVFDLDEFREIVQRARAFADRVEIKVVLGGSPDWSDSQLAALVALAVDTYTVQPLALPSGAPDPEAIARCLEVVRNDNCWRLGVQAHKVLGLR